MIAEPAGRLDARLYFLSAVWSLLRLANIEFQVVLYSGAYRFSADLYRPSVTSLKFDVGYSMCARAATMQSCWVIRTSVDAPLMGLLEDRLHLENPGERVLID